MWKQEDFYCEGDQALAQVAQRAGGVFLLGDIQKPQGHCPGQPTLGDPSSAGGLVGPDDLQSSLPASTPSVILQMQISVSRLCSSGARPLIEKGFFKLKTKPKKIPGAFSQVVIGRRLTGKPGSSDTNWHF